MFLLQIFTPSYASNNFCGKGLLPEVNNIAEFNKIIKVISKNNLRRLYKTLKKKPLTPQEKKLLKRALSFGVILYTYRYSKALCLYGKEKKIPAVDDGMRFPIPTIENKLYHANQCIFASLGENPPFTFKTEKRTITINNSAYGSVLVIIHPKAIENGWATLQAGAEYIDLSNMRKGNKSIYFTTNTIPISLQDREGFTKQVFAQEDWNTAMALMLIESLREKSKKVQEELIKQLLLARNRHEFLTITMKNFLGYLEVKLNKAIPIEAIQAIMLNKTDYEHFKRCPGFDAWKHKVKVLPILGRGSP